MNEETVKTIEEKTQRRKYRRKIRRSKHRRTIRRSKNHKTDIDTCLHNCLLIYCLLDSKIEIRRLGTTTYAFKAKDVAAAKEVYDEIEENTPLSLKSSQEESP